MDASLKAGNGRLSRALSLFEAHTVFKRADHERDRASQRVVFSVVACVSIVIAHAYGVTGEHAWTLVTIFAAYAVATLAYRLAIDHTMAGLTAPQYAFVLLDPIVIILAVTLEPETFVWAHAVLLVNVSRCGIRFGHATFVLTWTVGAAALAVCAMATGMWASHPQSTMSLAACLLFAWMYRPLIDIQRDSVRQLVQGAAAQADAAKRTRFLARLAHEIRTPLQSIIATTDLQEIGVRSVGDAETTKRLRGAAKKLSRCLDDLLTIAGAEAGSLRTRQALFEAGSLVREVCDQHDLLAREKGLILHAPLPDEPVFVTADADRIAQILTNLLSNAVKYTAHGSITVGLDDSATRGGPLTFWVTDTGRGIPAHQHEKVFDAFQRADMESGVPGTGLGLSVVRTLVTLMSGTIRLDSAPGQGSTFRVEIPVVGDGAAAALMHPGPAERQEPVRRWA